MMVRRVFSGFQDDVGKGALAIVELGPHEELGHAEHAVHGRADLVAHVGEKFRLRPLAGFGCDARFLERPVGRLEAFLRGGDPVHHREENEPEQKRRHAEKEERDEAEGDLQHRVAVEHVLRQRIQRALDVGPDALAAQTLQVGEGAPRGVAGIVAEDIQPVRQRDQLADVAAEARFTGRSPEAPCGGGKRKALDAAENLVELTLRGGHARRRTGGLVHGDATALDHADVAGGRALDGLVGGFEPCQGGPQFGLGGRELALGDARDLPIDIGPRPSAVPDRAVMAAS